MKLNWTGTIYRQDSGDYRILTEYSVHGEFCTMKYRGKIIGYETDSDKARAFCEAHAAKQVSPTAAMAAGE